MDHWGNDVVSGIYFSVKGVAIFKLSYNYMKITSLQNVVEKIINDSITLFMYNILKAIVLQFFVHLSYFPTRTSVLNCVVSHI